MSCELLELVQDGVSAAPSSPACCCRSYDRADEFEPLVRDSHLKLLKRTTSLVMVPRATASCLPSRDQA